MKRRQLGNLLRWIGGREGAQDACAPWTHLLSLYADSEATPQQAQRMAAHLEACASCRASLALLRATTHVASAWTEQDMPSGLSERLSLAIANEARMRRVAALDADRAARRRFGAPQAALGGIALFAAIGIGVYLADHHVLSTPSHPSSMIAAKPSHGTVPFPDTGGINSAKPTIVAARPVRPSEPLTPKRMIVATVPSEMRSHSTLSPVAKTAETVRPSIQSAPSRIAHPVQIAANTTPRLGTISHPRLKTHGLVTTEVARAMKPLASLPHDAGSAAHEDGALAPAPSVTVAAVPTGTPDTPVVRLASTLKSLARSTQHIEPGTDQVSVSMVRAANYTGSATIVGSEIH